MNRNRLFIILTSPLILSLYGCQESREEADRRQQTANSAATIYEAATAVEQGAPTAAPLKAIKANASAIATAQGHPYPVPVTPAP